MTQQLFADVAFPELQKQLQRNPEIVGKIFGYFKVKILQKGQLKTTWFIVLRGREKAPKVTQTKPTDEEIKGLQGCTLECEDKDFLKIITGGMNGIKAYSTNKLKIEGDLKLATKIEHLFVNANGVQKVSSVISRRYPSLSSKL